MADSKDLKKSKPSSGVAAAIEREAAKVGDPQAQKMLRAGRSLGNEELQKRIQSGNATRDELIAFLTQRLGTIREVQLREIDAAKRIEDWRFVVSDSHKEGMSKPDPTRWRGPAKLYEEAAFQLSRGSLSRGADLMKRALDAEQKLVGATSGVVNLNDIQGELEAEIPPAVEEVEAAQGCGATGVPAEVQKLADEILNVTERAVDPPVRRRVFDPWWTIDEEEEEEKKPDGAS
jgi:hypothetical protein